MKKQPLILEFVLRYLFCISGICLQSNPQNITAERQLYDGERTMLLSVPPYNINLQYKLTAIQYKLTI
jgi:hypothetical protein